MSSSRWRKVRADLSSNKLRSALAIVSLAVGTTAVGTMVLAGSALDASPDASLRDANPSVGRAEGRRIHRTEVTGPKRGVVHVIGLGIVLVELPELFAIDLTRAQGPTARRSLAAGGVALLLMVIVRQHRERVRSGCWPSARPGPLLRDRVPGERPVDRRAVELADRDRHRTHRGSHRRAVREPGRPRGPARTLG